MSKECIECGFDLSGSGYTLPGEDGDNPYGYWTCRSCGAENIDLSTDDD